MSSNNSGDVFANYTKLRRKITISFLVDTLLYLAIASIFTYFAMTSKDADIVWAILLFVIGPWLIVILRIWLGRSTEKTFAPIAVLAGIGLLMVILIDFLVITGDIKDDGQPLTYEMTVYVIVAFSLPILIYLITGIIHIVLMKRSFEMKQEMHNRLNGSARSYNIPILRGMDGAKFEVYTVAYSTGYRTVDVTVNYNREVPVYGDVKSTIRDDYGNWANITTRGVTGTRTVSDKIKVGEKQEKYTRSTRTSIINTNDLDAAVKAYDDTICYADQYKFFVVHYYDFSREISM